MVESVGFDGKFATILGVRLKKAPTPREISPGRAKASARAAPMRNIHVNPIANAELRSFSFHSLAGPAIGFSSLRRSLPFRSPLYLQWTPSDFFVVTASILVNFSIANVLPLSTRAKICLCVAVNVGYLPDLLRLLRLFRYGDRPCLYDGRAVSAQFRISLEGTKHLRVLAHVAYHGLLVLSPVRLSAPDASQFFQAVHDAGHLDRVLPQRAVARRRGSATSSGS
jgi:hypothetical protein